MTTVSGGVYAERCIEPFWDDVYGSGGRAAAAMSGVVPNIRLETYRAAGLATGLENLELVYGVQVGGPAVPDHVAFSYLHSLATPRIWPNPGNIHVHAPIDVVDDVVLRFGMLEGSARVQAKRAVYDPQSAFAPVQFSENGSTADELAIVLNAAEAHALTGQRDPGAAASRLIASQGAAVVVVKVGSRGAHVITAAGRRSVVPAYESPRVWKVGSGDVFSAAFTRFWAIENRPPEEAADLASRATSVYCGTRSLPIGDASALTSMALEPVRPGTGRVYVAGPFFRLEERWLVEEARSHLRHMNVDVFSPLHDVGPGPASVVAPADLEALDECKVVLALLGGGDVGTVFEVGYAVAKGMPVVAFAQAMRGEDLKMIEGSGCLVLDDFVSAIYHAAWAL